MNNNKIFFDFEFIENGAAFVMEPISLGMQHIDGRSLYLEFDDVDWSKANQWVLDNVKPYLQGRTVSKYEARQKILEFSGAKPQFWAYYADYDWVLLCQLFGKMIELPSGWPMWARDLKQLMWHMGLNKDDIPVQNLNAHNALADARWNKEAYEYLVRHVDPLADDNFLRQF